MAALALTSSRLPTKNKRSFCNNGNLRAPIGRTPCPCSILHVFTDGPASIVLIPPAGMRHFSNSSYHNLADKFESLYFSVGPYL
jgi:hypothetical protein